MPDLAHDFTLEPGGRVQVIDDGRSEMAVLCLSDAEILMPAEAAYQAANAIERELARLLAVSR